jgi:hypothetical protein
MKTIEELIVYAAAYGSLAVVIGIAVYMIVLAVRDRRGADRAHYEVIASEHTPERPTVAMPTAAAPDDGSMPCPRPERVENDIEIGVSFG